MAWITAAASCGPRAGEAPDCDAVPQDQVAGFVPPAYEPETIPDLDCDRPSMVAPQAPRPLPVWPGPDHASYEGSRATLELEFERRGGASWMRSARFSWYAPETWAVDRFDGWRCGVELDPLEGVDDCRVRVYSGIEFRYGIAPGSEPDLGPVTLTTPGWQEELPRSSAGYYAELMSCPAWNTEYGVAWSGDGVTVDGDTVSPALHVGRELELEAPASGSELSPGELDVAWPGCGEQPLLLVLLAAQIDLTRGDVVEIVCHVEDDGAFTIPQDAMQHVSAGWFGELSLERTTQREHEIEERLFVEARTVVVNELTFGS